MTLVVDSSAAVAAALDEPGVGAWVREVLAGDLLAPAHMVMEATSAVRRSVIAGRVPDTTAGAAVARLNRMPVRAVPFPPFAERVWQLRRTVSVADAWYVAVAERLGAPLLTADLRLARASGPRCEFLLPPGP